jgi:hypothetical protein
MLRPAVIMAALDVGVLVRHVHVAATPIPNDHPCATAQPERRPPRRHAVAAVVTSG